MSKKKPSTVTGVLVINKHSGVTSHKIVSSLRRLYDMSAIGHTGTLDPLATGVLPVLFGRAVKAADFLLCEDKRYTAEMRLGITTDTEDITGEVLERCGALPDEREVMSAVGKFVGEIYQTPPMYSAIKVGGRKLCDLAREKKEVERAPRKVTVYSADAEKISDDLYRLDVSCSKGTYIRTLCADIGKELGCGAVMESLCRTRSGRFELCDAVTVEEIEKMDFAERLRLVRPVESLFEELASIDVNDFYAKLVKGGTELYQSKLNTSFPDGATVRIRHKGEFIALAREQKFADGSALKPIKLFVL